MEPCTLVFDRRLTVRRSRDAQGRAVIEVTAPPPGEDGEWRGPTGYAVALLVVGALAASAWWVAVILWML